jgi:hypothetical protein
MPFQAHDVSMMSGDGEHHEVALFDAAALHRLVEVLIEPGYRVVRGLARRFTCKCVTMCDAARGQRH